MAELPGVRTLVAPLTAAGLPSSNRRSKESPVRSPIVVVISLLFALGAALPAAAERYAPSQGTNLLEIRSVTVDGRPVSWRAGRELRLRDAPEMVAFGFGPVTNAPRAPIRLRYKLEGYDDAWHEGGGDMNLTIRFYDEAGDQIGQKIFRVRGNSAGWNGALDGSVLTHRREALTVPPQASRLWVVISSAGPPATVGTYVVDDLVVSTLSSTNAPVRVLLRTPFGLPSTSTLYHS